MCQLPVAVPLFLYVNSYFVSNVSLLFEIRKLFEMSNRNCNIIGYGDRHDKYSGGIRLKMKSRGYSFP